MSRGLGDVYKRQWLEKALREGKERSSWDDPDEAYERRARSFLSSALAGQLPAAVAAFVARIDQAAVANGLGQLLLKLTSPGVPDIYQGTELRDFSLVDPDNRRPVDFGCLTQFFSDGDDTAAPKLAILRRILAFRTEAPELYARGEYHPLRVDGPLADHVLAFARELDGRIALTVITRHLGRLLLDAPAPVLPAERWNGTAIPLPGAWRGGSWCNLLGAAQIEVVEKGLSLAPLLGELPVACVAAGLLHGGARHALKS